MESVYHIVTIRVNETSFAHVWRLRFRYLGTGYDTAFRTSHSDVVADAAWQAITSWVCSNKIQVQNSIHYLLHYRKRGLWGEEGYSQDGDGTPLGCDGGAEHSSTARSA
jgi:hypothetical protein